MARLPRELDGVSLLILNAGELATRVGRPLTRADELEAAMRDVQAQGARDLVVTRGAEGVLLTTPDGILHLPAMAADIVDVTGAGDAFAAAVCWSLLQSPDQEHALELACRRGLALSALTLGVAETVYPQLTPELLANTNSEHIAEQD
jgi:pseudouridine kinase